MGLKLVESVRYIKELLALNAELRENTLLVNNQRDEAIEDADRLAMEVARTQYIPLGEGV